MQYSAKGLLNKKWGISFLFIVFVTTVFLPGLRAERASSDEMALVCQNWLNLKMFSDGNWAGVSDPRIDSARLVDITPSHPTAT